MREEDCLIEGGGGDWLIDGGDWLIEGGMGETG